MDQASSQLMSTQAELALLRNKEADTLAEHLEASQRAGEAVGVYENQLKISTLAVSAYNADYEMYYNAQMKKNDLGKLCKWVPTHLTLA